MSLMGSFTICFCTRYWCCNRGYAIVTHSGVVKKSTKSGKHKSKLSASIAQCHGSMCSGAKIPRTTFPKKRWRVVIKGIDPRIKGLWKTGKPDVVCGSHFTTKYYSETLLCILCFHFVPRCSINEKERMLKNLIS